ncbi:protease HtpX [Buchnera aphidicola (Mollitrichosiphum nigrofasciatum)]|uniref:protease HtpX n=1 Tax=Buchnera aphidicola TaxID=9 RepID=UPI0031B84F98
MTRIILFTLTNLSVVFLLSIIFKITGINIAKHYELIILSSVFGFGGSLLSLLLSKWIALRAINGKIIIKPNNEIENWLIKTIKNQSIKAGIKTPDTVIYKNSEINAFATGPNKNNALIAVSTELLNKMKLEEIEAVLAHEISHIANGDMVTMTLLQGVVNTFVIFFSKFIAEIISNVFEFNKEESTTSKKPTIIYFILSTMLELTLGILASILTMWFSRRREFYADAGAAKIAGTEKMISALIRLKMSNEPIDNSSISSLCIHGKSKYLSNLFLSHPPLDVRISALNNKTYIKIL